MGWPPRRSVALAASSLMRRETGSRTSSDAATTSRARCGRTSRPSALHSTRLRLMRSSGTASTTPDAAKDPEGGAWPAYPSGKSWDEPSGKTGSGKKFYHNVIDGSKFAAEPFYVAIITPVIHYCMGGLETDVNA